VVLVVQTLRAQVALVRLVCFPLSLVRQALRLLLQLRLLLVLLVLVVGLVVGLMRLMLLEREVQQGRLCLFQGLQALAVW
jgi:hypothetical protein